LSAAGIVETLAKELSIEQTHVQRVHELLAEGHRVPYITRYRRSEIGPLTDGVVRRLARRLKRPGCCFNC
jgi:transcriptional accessory protein Tex/SPT6